ncbi:hypothetical protein PF008_g565 [Phytophthora fragariae]|uniref:Uncharacterized protein n=1 Tax=Phytophthora fragariae TaxID=53985 RepID=A0A6G0SNG8_9STRA|nr:hypothetical protein PF008_g565 [Phytophthora fragariae]
MTAKRPNPDEQDEYDLLGYLGVDYKMEKAWSRDGDDPAGDGNDNKAGGDRSEDEENLDGPIGKDGDQFKHLDEAYERESTIGTHAMRFTMAVMLVASVLVAFTGMAFTAVGLKAVRFITLAITTGVIAVAFALVGLILLMI